MLVSSTCTGLIALSLLLKEYSLFDVIDYYPFWSVFLFFLVSGKVLLNSAMGTGPFSATVSGPVKMQMFHFHCKTKITVKKKKERKKGKKKENPVKRYFDNVFFLKEDHEIWHLIQY